MNESATKVEEQIISLFPEGETQVCQGWILKKMGGNFTVYPLYYKFSQGNILENIRKCEEICRQGGVGCVFRIVEHTNYHLNSVLMDNGYQLGKCGVVGEWYPAEMEGHLCEEKMEKSEVFYKQDSSVSSILCSGVNSWGFGSREFVQAPMASFEYKGKRLSLKKRAGMETVEYVMAEPDKTEYSLSPRQLRRFDGMAVTVGIKRQGLLFLPDGNLPGGAGLGDILRFAMENGVTRILADIPEREELPEQYRLAGFHRAYRYCCYQKEEKSSEKQERKLVREQEEKFFSKQEEKSSEEQEEKSSEEQEEKSSPKQEE